MALNGGLFETAKNASDKTKVARDEEKVAYTVLAEYYQEKANGGTQSLQEFVLEKQGVEVGDMVAYDEGTGLSYTTNPSIGVGGDASGTSDSLTEVTYTTEQAGNLEWKVLGVNDAGQIELISTNPTDVTLTFYIEGFDASILVNEKTELDKFCNNLYGQGNGATKARSLTVEDVNKLGNHTPTPGTKYKFKYDPNEWRLRYIESSNASRDFSEWHLMDTDAIDSVDLKVGPEQTEGVEWQFPGYNYTVSDDVQEILGASNKSQWLANTFVDYAYSGTSVFNPLAFTLESNSKVNFVTMSFNYENNSTLNVRPVVTLNPNAKLVDTNEDGILEIQ